MNGPEMKNIERWLERPMAWPLAGDDYATIVRRANQERAKYLAAVIGSLGSRIAGYARAVRDLAEVVRGNAEACTAARLHQS